MSRRDSVFLALVAVAYVCPGADAAVAAGVQASVAPADTTVDPGASFEIRLEVPQAGDAFNGYEATVLYEPSRLTFVPNPSSQEGSLMTQACPVRFEDFAEAQPGSLSVTHVLLCAGVRVTGPGTLYILQFDAGLTQGTTTISLGAGTTFFDAGNPVLPLQLTEASILIGQPVSVGPRLPSLLSLSATPNPFNPRTTLRYATPSVGRVRLTVHDPRGHLIAVLINESEDAGEHLVSWDGRDTLGASVSTGVYFARLQAAGGVRTESLVLLK